MTIANAPKPLTMDDVMAQLDEEEKALFLELKPDGVQKRIEALTTYDKFKEIVRVTGRETLNPTQTVALAKLADTLGPNTTIHYNAIFEPAPQIDMIKAALRHEMYDRNRAKRDVADNGS